MMPSIARRRLALLLMATLIGAPTVIAHTTRHFNSFAVDERSGDLILVGERIVRLVRQSSGAMGRANEQP
jgi:hypothetical protein